MKNIPLSTALCIYIYINKHARYQYFSREADNLRNPRANAFNAYFI